MFFSLNTCDSYRQSPFFVVSITMGVKLQSLLLFFFLTTRDNYRHTPFFVVRIALCVKLRTISLTFSDQYKQGCGTHNNSSFCDHYNLKYSNYNHTPPPTPFLTSKTITVTIQLPFSFSYSDQHNYECDI